VNKISKPFVFLEVSTTTGYANNMGETAEVLLKPPDMPESKPEKTKEQPEPES
jgi:hypothetical protein